MTNTALYEAIRETKMPYAKLAALINRVGVENGQAMYYDAAAVAHWLTGTTPLPGVVPVIVEAFTRALGRDVTASDLGWPDTGTAPGNPWDGDPVAWVNSLGRDDMLNRRSLLTAGLYSLAALNLPSGQAAAATRPGQPARAGMADVERIRAMTAQFATADDLFGGGHARPAVAAYLVNEVTPLLHGTTGRARPALFTAASRLAYLAGFMASDACKAGLAQRYYIQAVRLADEAGDSVAKATALRGLALQAVELGHPDRAVHLADAAAAALGDACPLRVRAWITGMRAEAYAAAGDTSGAITALREAEAAVERADSAPESEWTGAYRRAALEHQTGAVLAQLSDLSTAERHLIDSIRARAGGERRSRVLIASRLAGVQLRQRRPEEAAATVLALRQDLPLLSSGRVTRELTRLRAGWATHRSIPVVGEADRLIAGLGR